MDFTQRGPGQNQSTEGINSSASNGRGRRHSSGMPWHRLSIVILLACSSILLLALLIYVITSNNPNKNSEVKYVNTSENQAVFLNGGQVYFGHITAISNDYLRLSNIYYLQVNQTVQPNGSTTQTGNPTLVPLGCELHRPENEMVINQSQVIFWENLKNDTDANTVPGAIAKDVAANPNGHQCTTSSSSSSKQ